MTLCEVCGRRHDGVDAAIGWALLGAVVVIVVIGFTALAGRHGIPGWAYLLLWLSFLASLMPRGDHR